MASIQITNSVVALLKEKQIADKPLLLIADDGGGDYSLLGGACSLGAKFSIVELEQPDPKYAIELENNVGLQLYTSKYDLTFMGKGLKLDFKNYRISLKDDSGLLDGGVQIAKGSDIKAAFAKGIFAGSTGC
ncbi:hypothetical protein FC83_GL003036 [Agrilactobacillus composti DSM 18527 = JCM 14202]|uniref:Core domain-containing protein n=1 Tax=Agrilactobacillus composti DSM 18527 = JCM 14202 TaxID=1423734 RepID=X0PS76_9LACO|nr:iron-sulfur cluster biosynthesis family protein [Agrilactobacillus composti]KRM36283.1 hypothetical protein FC83_GL003036 [Agrilactobacillus composti DSM 18527 = JCM 14202]GAF40031.1 hypothetical protein JCM14202_1915 [Agrilactobacillus composti DSM 18527 = JCM 14202]